MKNGIEIPAGHADLVKKVMDDFNQRYKTDFQFKDAEDRDGVIFAIIDQGSAHSSDVFLFGFFYGMLIKEKRLNKEIDY
ncbi:MAG: hypothetical protein ABIQ40_07095 [Bacteroidia bacterium]